MQILITGASSNVGRGIIPRLCAAGHELVLSDITRLPDADPFIGLPFVQCDVQVGFGLERAAQGCDLVLHLPAWHGIHWREKTEIDFWRLNVDGAFWMFQAAVAANIKRVVFLSSQAWHGHYDKYGFTKRVGEELCEYNRRNHGVRFVAVRPTDFTPWGDNYTRYGTRLLYGGVDREDVLDCIQRSVEKLSQELPEGGEAEGIVANAVRPNAFSEEQIADWEADPLAACESIFPGSRALVEKYQLNIERKPGLSDLGEGAAAIGYVPRRHFGTFLDELKQLDAHGGEEEVKSKRCSY